MPSFDVVSKTDFHELANAIDQTNRELGTRFDFKDADARVEHTKSTITLTAPSEFQLKQLDEILKNKLAKRQIDIRVLEYKDPSKNLKELKQDIEVKNGLSVEVAKKIIKLIKDSKIKVQATIQSDQVRVSGKKRDDLQEAIAFLKASKIEVPIQFENFRD